jgi:voltage-gated potassium channel
MGTRLLTWLRRPLTHRSLGWFVLYRLRWALTALIVLFVVGTCGYVIIEHYGWIDAAFMTVITLSTVGYEEVHPLGHGGQIFTIFVIIASFGTFVYAATQITELFSSGSAVEHLRESRGRRMRNEMEGHVIVVGFGRVGQAAAKSLADLGTPCLVMDRNGNVAQEIREMGCVPMVGDATDEGDLVEAGIHRAIALVAAAEQDDINLVITLTARALRPDLRIVSRVNEAGWRDRIVRAGADVALSPYPSYGISLATSAISPGVLDFHALPLLGLGTEEIEIPAESAYVGRQLGDLSRAHAGVHIVGLRRDRRLQRWTDVAGEVRGGDVLVALGTPDSLRSLAEGA